MLDLLKKLFTKKRSATEPSDLDHREITDKTPDADASSSAAITCKTCGKPIAINPSWRRIPKYCADCSAKYKAAQQAKRGLVTITCKNCGKTETIPANVQHWPDLCQECRAKLSPQQVTRTCRGCGKQFSFPSNLRHWPNYCRDCQAKRKKKR